MYKVLHSHVIESITIIIKIPINTNILTVKPIACFNENQVSYRLFFSQIFNKIALTNS
jgi:hypothetical protein